MIAFLRGKIKIKENNFVIIVVNDVGYKIFVNDVVRDGVTFGDEVELFIHHHVREDAVTLFGFFGIDELEMFELLLTVSGIGPKSALGVLAAGETAYIKDSIASGDADFLTKVSGIGKKTAERVVMELRDKIVSMKMNSPRTLGSEASSNADEIDALIALGYSMMQAREALRAVDPGIKDSRERIREALKNI